MHNESMATRQEPTESKIKKFAKKSARNAGVATLYVAPVALIGVTTYFGFKTQKLQYEAAKLALEAAKKA
jgi:hypothetical protein